MSQEHCYITVKVGKSECSEADFSKYVESAFTRHDWGEHHIYYDGELREYIVRGVKLHAGSIFFELKSVPGYKNLQTRGDSFGNVFEDQKEDLGIRELKASDYQ